MPSEVESPGQRAAGSARCLQQIDAAAQAAKETAQQWMADVLAKAAGGK